MIEPILAGKELSPEWEEAISHMSDLIKEHVDLCILYEMITGKRPESNMSGEDLQKEIDKKEPLCQ